MPPMNVQITHDGAVSGACVSARMRASSRAGTLAFERARQITSVLASVHSSGQARRLG